MNTPETQDNPHPPLPPAQCSATGWWNPNPYSHRRRIIFHYVSDDGRTLCGKWDFVGHGTVEDGQDDHSENCAQCKKKKLALNAKSVKSPNVKISDWDEPSKMQRKQE